MRDAITRRVSPTHDYLAHPEIVQDFADFAFGSRSLMVVEKFQEITKPCIVKFRSTEPRDDVAEVALRYCYSALWGMKQSLETNTCFDGGGRTIPRSDILKIEYLESA